MTIRGYTIASPPGDVFCTDRVCDNSDFCNFYNADALSSDGCEIPEDEWICTGCNNEIKIQDQDEVDEKVIEASRKDKDPDYT